MTRIHIAVMDYCTGSIKMYNIEMPDNWQAEDVEKWLCDNTDYDRDQCYYMGNRNEIPVEYL